MRLWVELRRATALMAAAWFIGPGAVAAPDPQPVAHGLIVKLKNGAAAAAATDDVAGRRERLQRVMRDAGWRDAAVQRVRPVGRHAQHLDFGKPLAADEAERLMAQLRARADVEWVEPNTRERRLAAPNDPFYPLVGQQQGQWWMYPVGGSSSNALVDRRRGVPGFETAWNRTTGVVDARVAVLDTGIVAGHPELTGRVLPGYDFVRDVGYANDGSGRDADPSDPGDWVSQSDKETDPGRYSGCAVENSSWHGTDIAGLIVATTNDARGTAAINWNGRVLPVRVAGKCGADPLDIVDGMYWAAGLASCLTYDAQGNCTQQAPINPNPARIINISFGGTGSCNVYQQAIDDLRAAGVVIVAAAGNEQGAVTRPAKCPGVVGVGAVNRDGFKTNYSNLGPELTITTVGGDPQSTSNGNWAATLGDEGILGIDVTGATSATGYGYAYLFGTSFSAPIVAGAVSLMLSVNPSLTHAQILEGLRSSARRHVVSDQMAVCSAGNYGRCICTTATCGAGLLDVDQALIYAAAPASYVAPNWPIVNIDSPQVTAAVQSGADEPDAESVGGGGGGALQPAWLLALALAVLLLAATPPRRRAPRR